MMITNSKKDFLISKIRDVIYNSPELRAPYEIDSPANRQLCNNIDNMIKATVLIAIEELINDLYTQEQFEEDIGLK
jgi:hypothetical protein